MRLHAVFLLAMVAPAGCSVDAPTYTTGDGAACDDAVYTDGLEPVVDRVADDVDRRGPGHSGVLASAIRSRP